MVVIKLFCNGGNYHIRWSTMDCSANLPYNCYFKIFISLFGGFADFKQLLSASGARAVRAAPLLGAQWPSLPADASSAWNFWKATQHIPAPTAGTKPFADGFEAPELRCARFLYFFWVGRCEELQQAKYHNAPGDSCSSKVSVLAMLQSLLPVLPPAPACFQHERLTKAFQRAGRWSTTHGCDRHRFTALLSSLGTQIIKLSLFSCIKT